MVRVKTDYMFKICSRSWTIIFCSILADQYTKIIAVEHLSYHQPVAVLPFLNFFLTYNEGAAFSFLSDAGGWQRWFLIIISVTICLAIVNFLGKLDTKHTVQRMGLIILLSGAIGNLIDRIRNGYVIDFIQIYYESWYWPTFNIADSLITIGVVILAADILIFEKRRVNDS